MTTLDDFEHWLADMDDALDRFFAQLEPALRANLDYSVASLDALEAALLARYPDPDAMLAPGEVGFVDGAVRYIGETIRKQVGGTWRIRLDDPDYVFHGMPELAGFADRSSPECPHSLATAAMDRRTGVYIGKIVAAMQRRYRR
jgi:hypothetical protein